jgi:hypothetical protein
MRRLGRRRRWFNIDEAKQELEKHKPVQGTYLSLLKGYGNVHGSGGLFKPFNIFEHQAISPNNNNNNNNINTSNYHHNHSHLYFKHHHNYNNHNNHQHHHSHNNHSNIIMPSMISSSSTSSSSSSSSSSSMPYSVHTTNGAATTNGLVASAVSLPNSTSQILLPK